MKKRALITGVFGQDGYYLADLLLRKQYQVIGIYRTNNDKDLKSLSLNPLFIPIKLDICEIDKLDKILSKFKPDEFYHLACESSASLSIDFPFKTYLSIVSSTIKILELIRSKYSKIKFFNASSSEVFGFSKPQRKYIYSPHYPSTPYGMGKSYIFNLVKFYRQKYNLFLVNGILFNHESPRRNNNFITKKIVSSVFEIKKGIRKSLILGNLNSKRDWSYAPDFVNGYWLSLNQKISRDYIFASGKLHSVKDILEISFNYFQLNYEKYIKKSNIFERAHEDTFIYGDIADTKKLLKWKAEMNFIDMIEYMIQHESMRETNE